MDTYDLVFLPESGGDPVVLASVRDGDVSGRMRRSVERQIALGEISLGLTGRTLRYKVTDPDLVAYALARANMDLIDAGVGGPGRVFAVDEEGDEIAFRYSASVGPDILIPEDQGAPTVD